MVIDLDKYMTEFDVVMGIESTTCKAELSDFLDVVQAVLNNDKCLVDDWDLITEVTKSKVDEFNQRVFH